MVSCHGYSLTPVIILMEVGDTWISTKLPPPENVGSKGAHTTSIRNLTVVYLGHGHPCNGITESDMQALMERAHMVLLHWLALAGRAHGQGACNKLHSTKRGGIPILTPEGKLQKPHSCSIANMIKIASKSSNLSLVN